MPTSLPADELVPMLDATRCPESHRFIGRPRSSAMSVERSVRSLSLRDLLDARDAYHVHLLNLPNVVATAVGRYLKRRKEPASAPESVDGRLALTRACGPPRTLEGSQVYPWSWPVVLVFVDHWMDQEGDRRRPDAWSRDVLYLPDGRKVPTCVVFAPHRPSAPGTARAAPELPQQPDRRRLRLLQRRSGSGPDRVDRLSSDRW